MIKNLKPKLAEAGKIKIGGLGEPREKRGGGTYRIPVKYDHFKITKISRGADGDLELDDELMEAIGTDTDGKIRAIPIWLHDDDIDGVFPTSYALYSGKKCACRGDGETAHQREIKDKQFTGKERDRECPCDYLKTESGPKCKPNGKLYCSIMAPGVAVAGAVHIFRTTSIISIEQMIGSLKQIRSICGTLRGIPLWLMVKPVTVEPPGSGPITVFCCHVELRASDIEEVQQNALKAAETRRKLGTSDTEYRKMLSGPGSDETSTEQAEIDAEFYGEDMPVKPFSEPKPEPPGAEPAEESPAAELPPDQTANAEDEFGAEPEPDRPPDQYAIKSSENGHEWIAADGTWGPREKRLYYEDEEEAKTVAARWGGVVIPFPKVAEDNTE